MDPDDLDLPDVWEVDVAPPGWHARVVAALSWHLEAARRGQIVGLAIVSVTPDGAVVAGYTRGKAPIASLAYGAQHLLAQLLDHAE